MTELLRRFLRCLSSVSVTAVLLFLAFSAVVKGQEARHPLLFNSAPTSAPLEAANLIEQVEARAPDTAAQIERLGVIVALYAVPRLGSLSVGAQERLLSGLRPVRRRMSESVGGPAGLGGGRSEQNALDDDLGFWKRFVDERTLDFRPPVRARVVRRWLNGELKIRKAELFALDTYALPELVQAMGVVRTSKDAHRVHLLAGAMARLTGQNWPISKDATPGEAARLAEQIRRYWDKNSRFFLEPSPLAMIAETLRQTEFAVLLAKLTRGLRNTNVSATLTQAFTDVERMSAGIFASMFGALFLGPLIAAGLGLERVRHPHRSRVVLELATGMLALLSLGVLLDGSGPYVVRLGLATLVSTLTVAGLLTAQLDDRLNFQVLRVLERRSRRRRIVALLESFAPAAPVLVPLLVFEVVLVPVLCIWAEGHPAVWEQIVMSLRHGDLEYPMAIGLGLAFVVGILQAFAEPLRGALGRSLEELG